MPKNITIQKILGILLHRIRFIILVAVVAGLLTFLYTNFFITPQYATSAMIFVQNYSKADAQSDAANADKSDGNSSNNAVAKKIFSSDISGSNSLAGICVTLFQNSDEITALYDGCSVTMEVNENTFYITITVNGSDPQKCANVANQISEKCIEVYSKHFDYGQIGVIRTAKEPGSPISPDKMRSALIGAAIGLILACVISILLELIDTTIKPDEDLSEIYKVPVFAEIPDFDN
jgi:capsular polysaccharide biosynthesis protein